MKVLILNGPNINFLGIREPEIYGKTTYEDMLKIIGEYADKQEIEVSFYQSNHEGDLVDAIQRAYFDKIDGIVINPAAYTHTSIAILDALKAVGIVTVEVHLSAVEKREDFRQISYVSKYASKTITGQGVNGYLMALDYLKESKK
ncbi:MAG: type II 3-dehydroquinate dehydratase [Clostridia bacterium]|nr:type II 3-dehydroquinate dehydratase [Clostridia bacterium]